MFNDIKRFFYRFFVMVLELKLFSDKRFLIFKNL